MSFQRVGIVSKCAYAPRPSSSRGGLLADCPPPHGLLAARAAALPVQHVATTASPSIALRSSVQCAACAAAILMRFRLQFDSCACADVFYGCAVQAGHCYMLCKVVQPRLAFASVLQAASCFGAVFLGPGLATTPGQSRCTAAAIDGGRQKPSYLAQTCAKIAHKYLVARGTPSIARPRRRLSPVASSLAA